MSVKLAAISPRTNAMVAMTGHGGEDTTQFEQLFSQMAFSLIETKLPELMQSVVTFKIIESNIEENSALGVFILDFDGQELHVPIVLSEGQVQKPEVFYSKQLDAFLPLNKPWIESTLGVGKQEIGTSQEAPSTLPSDMDIQAITQPPSTGRLSFAEYKPKGGAAFSKEAMAIPRLDLKRALEKCSNPTKRKFSKLLSKHAELLNTAIGIHGSALLSWLEPRAEKVASAPKTEWAVLSVDTPTSEFKKLFGANAGAAFAKAAAEEIVTVDIRESVSVPVEIPTIPNGEQATGITQPKDSGFYKVVMSDGKVENVLITRPKEFGHWRGSNEFGYQRGFNSYCNSSDPYVIVFSDRSFHNRELERSFMAIATNEQPSGWFKDETTTPQKPAVGLGMFVSTDNSFDAIGPLRVKTVTEHKDHISILACEVETHQLYDEEKEEKYRHYVKFVVVKSLNTRIPHRPKGSDTTFIPASYSFIKLGTQKFECDMLGSGTSILRFLDNKLLKMASDKISLKYAGAETWSVNGEYAEELVPTVTKLASLGVRTYDAVDLVKKHRESSRKEFYLVPKKDMSKLGSIFGPDVAPPPMDPAMDPAMAGGAPPPGAPMDPAMAGGAPPPGAPMDPAMAGGAPPPGAPMDPAMAGGMPPQGMDPSMMQAAAGLQDPAAFDTAAVTALMMSEDLQALVGDYLPDLEKALDSLGRILISLQVKKNKLTTDIGQEEYIKLESNVKTLLSGLGELVLSLGRVP